jgi:hypothetical protein
VRLTTLPPYCAVVKKSGNLNFLEPSGPPQACNGTALTFESKKQPLEKKKVSENNLQNVDTDCTGYRLYWIQTVTSTVKVVSFITL